MTGETIFARASGAGRAGVAVFRLSGPNVRMIGERLVGRLPDPRVASLRRVRNPAAGGVVDEGLVLFFEGPESFTGEDVLELHLHGGRAVEEDLYDALSDAGARPAAAGEFTRRALLNGKLDLVRIEGLADLIDAETTLQRKQALGQYAGRLSARAGDWRAQLIAALAPLEADIDFPDEEDVPAAVAARSRSVIEGLLRTLRAHLAGAGAARVVREGLDIALVGAPNAGKSSLLNRLSGDEKAIVSNRPGTTRDIIEVRMDLGGVAATLADTAGLSDAPGDEIEAEGAARARARAKTADIRIAVVDQQTDVSRETAGLLQPGDFIVLNKSDLGPAPHLLKPPVEAVFSLSAKTGEGVPDFLAALSARACDLASGPEGGGAEDAPLTRARHVSAVKTAVGALEKSLERIEAAPELAAEDVRLAARALGGITGAVGVEDVLEEIFSSFCIGK